MKLSFVPMLKRLLLVTLLGFAVTARADDPEWYQIDVIIFANTDTSGAASETWPAQPGVADLSKAVELVPAGTPGSGPGPVPYELLPDSQDKLAGVLNSISRSRLYRPILHLSWRQPVVDKADAVPIHIHGGTEYPAPQPTVAPAPTNGGADNDSGNGAGDAAPSFGDGTAAPSATPMATPAPAVPTTIPEIDGTLTVTRARYLHLWADLTYTAPIATADDPTPTLHRFRMQQHRRMRSGEIHYLDHPMFGVIVLATPYEPPKPPAPEPTPAPAPTAEQPAAGAN